MMLLIERCCQVEVRIPMKIAPSIRRRDRMVQSIPRRRLDELIAEVLGVVEVLGCPSSDRSIAIDPIEES